LVNNVTLHVDCHCLPTHNFFLQVSLSLSFSLRCLCFPFFLFPYFSNEEHTIHQKFLPLSHSTPSPQKTKKGGKKITNSLSLSLGQTRKRKASSR